MRIGEGFNRMWGGGAEGFRNQLSRNEGFGKDKKTSFDGKERSNCSIKTTLSRVEISSEVM